MLNQLLLLIDDNKSKQRLKIPFSCCTLDDGQCYSCNDKTTGITGTFQLSNCAALVKCVNNSGNNPLRFNSKAKLFKRYLSKRKIRLGFRQHIESDAGEHIMQASQQNLDPQTPLKGVEHALRILQGHLGSIAGDVLRDKGVTRIEREDFRSRRLDRAGLHLVAGKENLADMHLFSISHPDGEQTFIRIGKVSGQSPYELGSGTTDGLDLRQFAATAYLYDGKQTLIEIAPDGTRNTIEGQFALPSMLLPAIRENSGVPVGSQAVER